MNSRKLPPCLTWMSFDLLPRHPFPHFVSPVSLPAWDTPPLDSCLQTVMGQFPGCGVNTHYDVCHNNTSVGGTHSVATPLLHWLVEGTHYYDATPLASCCWSTLPPELVCQTLTLPLCPTLPSKPLIVPNVYSISSLNQILALYITVLMTLNY